LFENYERDRSTDCWKFSLIISKIAGRNDCQRAMAGEPVEAAGAVSGLESDS
jgi:hypothetical protein